LVSILFDLHSMNLNLSYNSSDVYDHNLIIFPSRNSSVRYSYNYITFKKVEAQRVLVRIRIIFAVNIVLLVAFKVTCILNIIATNKSSII
jgi:hypothetical protein